MQLFEFRVRNYRSVNDSGPVEVRSRTALVGRNESGKSNLLNALRSLNPPEGLRALSKIKDFPKDRRMSEFREDLPVVDTRWSLSTEEQELLMAIYPRAREVKVVGVRRTYGTQRVVDLEGLRPSSFEPSRIPRAIAGLAQLRATIVSEGNLGTELGKLLDAATPTGRFEGPDGAFAWAEVTRSALQVFRNWVKRSQAELDGSAAGFVEDLNAQSSALLDDTKQAEAARAWVLERLPSFIYLHDYPDLEGHIDLEALLLRIESDKLKGSDHYFLKLMKVAGLDVAELHRMLPKNHELRQHLCNRGGAVVTKTIRRLWTDRALKVRFNLDANHFDTLISDPNAVYDVEVNLDERSRGFRWFFSFYVTFAADTEDGPAENAILLLDEPGLHLHAVAQRDLLEHFGTGFKNQILYTTHSPFMIPVDDLSSVRDVSIDEERGTRVGTDPGAIMDAPTVERFTRLMASLRKRFEAA